ncbi:MAG: DUF3857 domain-containing protein [Planctomycetota bacterium]
MRLQRWLLALVVLFLLSSASRADDIPAKITAAKGTFDGADTVVVFDSTDVTVADTGIGTNRCTRVVKVLTEAGVRALSVHRWDYDPATNTLELLPSRIHRAGGVEELNIKSAVVAPASAGIIFWGSQQTMLEVPGLKVGDSVELNWTKTGFNVAYLGDGGSGAGCIQPPMPGHWYDVVSWQEGVPVVEKRYAVTISKSKPLQYEVVNGEAGTSMHFDGDQAVYRFEKKNLPAFKAEPKMCSSGDVTCKLVLATVESWQHKARWFHEKNEPSFKTDDAIRAKVRELVGEPGDKKLTDEEKIATLNHWVAENVRYVGTSRGAHEGYTTHPAIETFHDRGGVCKDKAGLLVALLREAGFESYIVMTEAGARVEKTPADQFNHAVTSVRQKDGTLRLLDPTWLPKNREMWSSAEQRQAVVFGTPQGELGLQLSPYSPPAENAVTWRGEATLSSTGDMKGRMSVSTVGCPETSLRRGLSGIKPVDRSARFEESLRRLATGATLGSLTVTDPVDFSGPATVQMDYVAADYSVGETGQVYFRLPSMTGVLTDLVLPDVYDSAETSVKDRKYPARIRSTRRLDCEEVVTLPAGWRIVGQPSDTLIDNAAASMEFKVEPTDGQIRYRCKVELKKHIVPVDEYAGYKEVIDRLGALRIELVVCRREDQSAKR